jgi:hypothetical protein
MFHPDSGEYEFTEEQNQRIRRLSTVLMVFGGLSVILGGVLLWRTYLLYSALEVMSANPLYRNSQNLADVATAVMQGFLGALVPLLFGILSISSSRSFREIAHTRGSDIPNLLDALRSLGKMYALGFAGAVIMFGLMAASLFMARYLLL